MSQISIQGISVITSILLARVLGPAGRGAYALVHLFAANLVYFLNFGISESTVYCLGQKSHPGRQILGQNLLYAFGLSIAGALLGLSIVRGFGEQLFPGVPQELLILGLLLIPSNLLFGCLFPILLGTGRYGQLSAARVSRAALMVLGAVLFLIILRAGVPGAVLAETLSLVAVDVVLFVLARRAVQGVSLHFDASYLKNSVRYGVPMSLATLMQLVLFRADMLILNVFHSPAAVGFYAVSIALSEKLVLLAEGAGSVFFSKIASERDPARMSALTPLLLRAGFFASLTGAGLLAATSGWVVTFLYSERFEGSVAPLQVLAIGSAARCSWAILENDLKGRGRPGWWTATVAPAVVLSVALNLAWIPANGATGAAWASTCSMLFGLSLALIVYCRASGQTLRQVVRPRHADLMLFRRVVTESKALLSAAGKVTRRGRKAE